MSRNELRFVESPSVAQIVIIVSPMNSGATVIVTVPLEPLASVTRLGTNATFVV